MRFRAMLVVAAVTWTTFGVVSLRLDASQSTERQAVKPHTLPTAAATVPGQQPPLKEYQIATPNGVPARVPAVTAKNTGVVIQLQKDAGKQKCWYCVERNGMMACAEIDCEKSTIVLPNSK